MRHFFILEAFYSTNNYPLSTSEIEISTLRDERATCKSYYSFILKDLTVLLK